ncbi:MAG: TonB-dependent receptor [Prevotellaceae bacterium]|jgi:TonB-linked SusC/RagA family outer membrane protein|nr:TonB-dependent receptor [Prevotellaceae bacterium]
MIKKFVLSCYSPPARFRRRILLLFVSVWLTLCCVNVSAQKQVGGTVGNVAGEPLGGVSVVLKGSNVGVTTGTDGKYSINVQGNNSVLVFSYLGYTTEEITVGTKTVLDMVLKEAAQEFDEIVVVAYGTTKKSSFTGSASSVKSEMLEKRQVADVSKALQGSMSGVQVVSSSGQPGSSATIRIRGVGSISASSEPLYVVDGITVENSLSSINMTDIESVTTLKDAAANSLYGARGANGVVLITTKKGVSGKARVNFEARFGFNERGIPAYDVVTDKGQYLELLWEALRNKGIADGDPNPAAYASDNLIVETKGFNPFTNVPVNQVVGTDGKLNPAAVAAWNDDWLKDPFRRGFRNEEIISVSGGTGKNSYYMSVGYLDEKSYITASDFQRYTGRVKLEQEVVSWLHTGANISYAKAYMSNPWASNRASTYSNIFMFAQQNPPIYPIYQYDKTTGKAILDKNGNKQYEFNTPYSPGTNPLNALENDIRDSDCDYATASGFAEFSFLKDFKLKLSVSAETNSDFSNSFQTPVGGDALNVGGRNKRTSKKMFLLTSQQLLTWNKIVDGHGIDILAGHETVRRKNNHLEAEKENFLIPSNPELANGARLMGATSYSQTYSLESLLSRVQYNYREKYFLSASLRYDGSSRFSPDSRWGAFWSTGGAWIISKENFLNDISQLNELKLKVSYGTQGNDALLDPDGYLMYNVYQDQYEVSSAGGDIAVTYTMRGNPKLKWERSENFNTGIEFRLFDKIFGGVEYYQKITRDLLYQKPLATSQGLPAWIWDNAITMKNSGIEIELGVDIIKTRDFWWQIKGNLTTQKNKIMELPKDKDKDGKGYVASYYWYKTDGSIYDFYTYKSAGVDPATGKALWYAEEKDDDGNVTGDKVVTEYGEASKYQTGKSALPDIYGGMNTTVEWKGLELSVQTAFQFGGYGWDNHYMNLMTSLEDATSGIHKDVVARRWTAPGQITDVPRLQYGLGNQTTQSDRFLVSKSYFSINNITLGYTLPKKLVEKISIDKLKIFFTCENIALFSARQGYDPRIYISGSGTYAYSAVRSFSLGLNVNF